MEKGSHSAKGKKLSNAQYALLVSIGTFFTAAFINLSSQSILNRITQLYIAIVLLLVVIFIGIIFDVIGVAVAVADEAPFHARASRRLPGAKEALKLIRNADRVSNFCNDVIGDICGTLSGGIGASIVFNFFALSAESGASFPDIVVAGIVAAITVGGKAFGKSFAVRCSDGIMWKVGKVVAITKKLRQKRNKK